jgi:hypothetical protein
VTPLYLLCLFYSLAGILTKRVILYIENKVDLVPDHSNYISFPTAIFLDTGVPPVAFAARSLRMRNMSDCLVLGFRFRKNRLFIYCSLLLLRLISHNDVEIQGRW